MTGALQKRGYLQTLARPHATLRLTDSWQSYLQSAALHSKNLAHTIRQEIKRAHRDGVTFGEWNPVETPESELYRLIADHEQRLNDRAWRFRPGLLERLSQSLGTNFKVLVATSAAGLQGTTAFAVLGKRGYLIYPGLVAQTDRAGFAYFNLVFYEPIRLGISLGLESIEYGNGVYEAKIRRGLQRKYASFLQAAPFSNVARGSHAHPAHERAS
jgi:predicted N-acyltransferase